MHVRSINMAFEVASIRRRIGATWPRKKNMFDNFVVIYFIECSLMHFMVPLVTKQLSNGQSNLSSLFLLK